MTHTSSRSHTVIVVLVLIGLTGCQLSCVEMPSGEHVAKHAEADVEYLPSSDPAWADLPFSEAVRVGEMLYLTGQIGNIPGTLNLAEGGTLGQARQAMENIKAALERHGSSLAEVVKCTVMMADIAEWGAFNEVYVTYFPNHKPARSAFGTNGLALGAALEVECWATVD